MEKLRNYILQNVEQFFVFLILITVAALNYFLPQKIAFTNFYFLPVIAAGYFLGFRRSVLGAILCILLVTFYTGLNPQQFALPRTKYDLYFYLVIWGVFLILAGCVVGKQQEKLKHDFEMTWQVNRQIVESLKNLQTVRSTAILALAKLAEARDEDTGSHLERIQEFARVLAKEVSKKPKFIGYITSEYLEDLYQSSILHDIGKVAIPDKILLKPGRLTSEEFEIIKRHTIIGGDAIQAIDAEIGGRSFLTLAREIAYYHHEKWDGSGYPRGLKGDQIPLSARFVALADVYDALTSKRVYKEAYTHDEALKIIVAERGKHFDPDIVDAFLRHERHFDQIRQRLRYNEPQFDINSIAI